MSLSDLTNDIWLRVCTFLPPESLSSLSQVNTKFHKIATHDSIFLHNLPPEPNIRNPSLRYRRLHALAYPPSEPSIIKLSGENVRIVGSAHDTLILIDYTPTRFITFPHGISVNLEKYFRSTGIRSRILSYALDVIASGIFVLPDNCIGFKTPKNDLAVFNVKTGNLFEIQPLGNVQRFKGCQFAYGTTIAPAGMNSEWILYFDDEGSVIIQDWKTGALVRKIENVGDVKFITTLCSATDRRTIVGLVHESDQESVKQFRAIGFDGVEQTARFLQNMNLTGVIRSVDKRLHVFVTSTGIGYHMKVSFSAYRTGYDGTVAETWSGRLPMPSTPEIRENGRVIAPSTTAPGCHLAFDKDLDTKMLWLELKDNGNYVGTHVRNIYPRWMRRGPDGLFVLTRTWNADKRRKTLQYLKIVNEGGERMLYSVKKWEPDASVVDVYVVSDHFLIALCADQKLLVWHFDRFCTGAHGEHACRAILPENLFDCGTQISACFQVDDVMVDCNE